MPQKCETPAGTGASRNSLVRCFRDCLNPNDLQSQFLIAAYHVRPDLAATLASLAFGGISHG
jgi:hypothetical protein